MKKIFGFTLIELMVVVIIVGILTSLIIPTYNTTREKTLDREAKVALKLVRAGNRQYFVKNGFYYNRDGITSNMVAINGNLSTDLNSTNWAFSIVGGTTFTAYAQRGGRNWTINQNQAEPTCIGACFP